MLFEVHSLKLLAAHCFIQHQCEGQAGLGRAEGLGRDAGRASAGTVAQGLPSWVLLWPADLMPENVVEEKTKAMDLHAILAEIPRPRRPPLQWR